MISRRNQLYNSKRCDMNKVLIKNCSYCGVLYGCKNGAEDNCNHDCIDCAKTTCLVILARDTSPTTGTCPICHPREQAAFFLAINYQIFSYLTVLSVLAHEQRKYQHNLVPCSPQLCTECNLAFCPTRLIPSYKALPAVPIVKPQPPPQLCLQA